MRRLSDAAKEAENFANAFGDTTAVENLILKKIKGQGKLAAEAVKAQIASGAGALDLAEQYGISVEAIIKEQTRLAAGEDLAKSVNLTAKWDEESLTTAKKRLKSGLGDVVLTVAAANKDGGQVLGRVIPGTYNKDGGLIGRFADGWGPSYNGRVSGLGTARSDQIPAMISNGEFVVNARATAQNLALLNAINANKNVSGMGSGINVVVNAAPGMDEQQVASLVAHQLRTEMRKGATI
jgi:hypothetical protein